MEALPSQVTCLLRRPSGGAAQRLKQVVPIVYNQRNFFAGVQLSAGGKSPWP